MSDSSPTFYIGLYRKMRIFIFNFIFKKLQTYDFLLIFSDERLTFCKIKTKLTGWFLCYPPSQFDPINVPCQPFYIQKCIKKKRCLQINFNFFVLEEKYLSIHTEPTQKDRVYVFILQIIVLNLIIDAAIESARRLFLSIVTSEYQLTSS